MKSTTPASMCTDDFRMARSHEMQLDTCYSHSFDDVMRTHLALSCNLFGLIHSTRM